MAIRGPPLARAMDERAKVTRSTRLPFVQVATAIILDQSLTAQARHLYTVLATYADINSREAKLLRSTLAKDIGKSVDTLDRLVKELVGAGIVTVLHQAVNGLHTSSIYSLHDAELIQSRAVQNAEIDMAASVRLPHPEGPDSDDLSGRMDAASRPQECGDGGRMDAAGVAAPVRHIKRDLEQETFNESSLVDADASTPSPDALFDVGGQAQPKVKRKRKPSTYVDHPRFLEFWAVYPRTEDGRKPASIKFTQVVEDGADPNVIIEGAARHRDDPNREDRFTKHAATWLNQACWEDRVRAISSPNRPPVASGNQEHWNNPDADFGFPTSA